MRSDRLGERGRGLSAIAEDDDLVAGQRLRPSFDDTLECADAQQRARPGGTPRRRPDRRVSTAARAARRSRLAPRRRRLRPPARPAWRWDGCRAPPREDRRRTGCRTRTRRSAPGRPGTPDERTDAALAARWRNAGRSPARAAASAAARNSRGGCVVVRVGRLGEVAPDTHSADRTRRLVGRRRRRSRHPTTPGGSRCDEAPCRP